MLGATRRRSGERPVGWSRALAGGHPFALSSVALAFAQYAMPALCRDCLTSFERDASLERCRECGCARIIGHPELNGLAIAAIGVDGVTPPESDFSAGGRRR